MLFHTMSAQSTLSKDEKAKVKAAVNSPANKILIAVLARIYYVHPRPDEWTYAGLEGALAFVKDTRGVFHLKLVDLSGTRGILWEHDLHEGFEYFQARSFMYSYAGDECMVSVIFPDERDAKAFYKMVTSKKADMAKSKPDTTKERESEAGNGKIDKSMISGPTAGSFKHVAHMGYDAQKGFTLTNVYSSWEAFLDYLQRQGIPRHELEQNMDFVKDFVRDVRKVETASGGNPSPRLAPPSRPTPRNVPPRAPVMLSPPPPPAVAPPPLPAQVAVRRTPAPPLRRARVEDVDRRAGYFV